MLLHLHLSRFLLHHLFLSWLILFHLILFLYFPLVLSYLFIIYRETLWESHWTGYGQCCCPCTCPILTLSYFLTLAHFILPHLIFVFSSNFILSFLNVQRNLAGITLDVLRTMLLHQNFSRFLLHHLFIFYLASSHVISSFLVFSSSLIS